MNDPLINFSWRTLFVEYDKRCGRYDPNSRYISCLHEQSNSDRELYSILIKRIADEINTGKGLSFCTYSSLLYWKLYSQPAAVATVLKQLHEYNMKKKTTEKLLHLNEYLDPALTKRSERAVEIIRGLDGLGLHGMKTSTALPVRSTLLHFIYPEIIPVFDKMVLQAVGIEEDGANQSIKFFQNYLEHAWKLEEKYRSALKQIKGVSNIRVIDMALWITRGSSSKGAKNVKNDFHAKCSIKVPAGIVESKAGVVKGRKPNILKGFIRTLAQTASDGWERREIIIKQPAPSSYPQVRDFIKFKDSDNNSYCIPYIKGAHKEGFVCLGRPGDLKGWFVKHYPKKRVVDDEVIFVLLEDAETYRIYTSREWKEKRSEDGTS